MKFSIGDNIVLKRTGEEGRVTAFIDKQMIEVEVNGTIFPVYTEDVDHPYLKWFTEKTVAKKPRQMPEQLPVEKPAARAERLARGAYLSFMPVFKMVDMEEVADTVKIYLLNELPVGVRFSYEVRMRDQVLFRHEGALHAFGNVYLHSVPYGDMNDQPRFHWTLADAQDSKNASKEGVVRIKPAKLFEHVNQVLNGGSPSFMYLLADAFLPEVPKQEQAPVPVVRASRVEAVLPRREEQPKYELDIHIDQLVDDTKGLSNAEIITIQLGTLQRYLALAIAHRQERMMVIHGLGKGKLREEVHKILKTIPEVARYKNEWSGRYGFGATEVTFRYAR